MIFPIAGLLLASVAVSSTSQPTRDGTNKPIQPDQESARANSAHLFNAIHSVGRQWGSSYIHNGFGLVPATVKKGTLLYHGTYAPNGARPQGLEYLAFEIEYSKAFSTSFRPGDPLSANRQPPLNTDDAQQQRILGDSEDETGYVRGYLQTYTAKRDLNVLYIDGSAGAKTDMGSLDSQDILLRGGTGDEPNGYVEDRARAEDLCRILKPYGIDAIMRVEVGLEIIYCDFQDGGLELMSALRSFGKSDMIGDMALEYFQWLRGVSHRYDGVGAGQVQYDFSSMVSGFTFPINISHTNPNRPDLVRLKAAERSDLGQIKLYLLDLLLKPRRFNVGWQGIVDMIILHYSDRLAYMGSDIIIDNNFINELESVTLAYYDAPARSDDIDWQPIEGESRPMNRTADAIERCASHYLVSAVLDKESWDLEDAVIHAAISDLTGRICRDLFAARSVLLRAAFPDRSDLDSVTLVSPMNIPRDMGVAVSTARAIVHDLIHHLAWPGWKRARRCAVNEVEIVAMWPFGSREDHWTPGCRSVKDEDSFVPFGSYWLPHSRSKSGAGSSRTDEL